MYNYGRIVPQTTFAKWAAAMQFKQANNGILAELPPYRTTYDPTVVPQLASSIVKIDGITGAAGYYYPPQDPVTP
jgi:hypothetical protein